MAKALFHPLLMDKRVFCFALDFLFPQGQVWENAALPCCPLYLPYLSWPLLHSFLMFNI